MKRRRKKSTFGMFVKRVRDDKKLSRILILSVSLVIAVILICIVHLNQVIHLFWEVYQERLYDSVTITSEEITRSIDRKAEFIVSYAKTFGTFAEAGDKETICNTLTSITSSTEFDDISFVDKSSSLRYSSSGRVFALNYDKFEQALGNVEDYHYLYDNNMYDNSNTVSFVCPVTYENVDKGYLIGTVDAQKQFETIFATTGLDMTDSFLIDGSGKIICEGNANRHFERCAGKNFYTYNLRALASDEYSAINIAENMKMGIYSDSIDNLQTKSKTYGSVNILYSTVIGTKSWTVVSCLFSTTLVGELKPIIIESMVTVFALLVLIICLTIIVSRFAGSEQKIIYDLAYVDELTEAPNENAFKEKAQELLEDNPDLPYLIACFDVQNFRYINEGYGHEKADELLRAISKALAECYSYNETYARISADRFVGLTIDDGRNDERKKLINEHILAATDRIKMNYPIRFKTGLYYVKNPEESISSMIDKANLARKSITAVETGELVAEYVDKLMEATRKQEQIESRMEIALSNREFLPYLQPKWDMKNNCICGAEALVRWRYPDGTIIPPVQFIPLFEKNGFIEKIDFYMLESVCAYLRRMLDDNRKVYPVSINQSRFLLHNPEYVSRVQQILLKYKIPRGLLEFEITETVFTHEKDHMLSVMNQLKDLNMELSMDDFGSGYSSLNLLRDIPFDILKIDRGFLDESTQTESGKLILKKIVEMADGLKLRVICEGVETQEHVDMLLGIGCIYAQGYFYSKPIPMDEYVEKYNTKDE